MMRQTHITKEIYTLSHKTGADFRPGVCLRPYACL